ncbi:putative type VI secretion system effector [Scandinavium sp. M-37]|uniref:putative type VI secretion system effector n=1 Tax=Scandinavium sp. M-37 TaxID=3373077 RepID=UPI003744B620
MNANTKMSPQEWLDWQLRDFNGYKDLDELQSCLLSSHAKIEAARLNIQKYTSPEFAGMYNREDIQRNEDRIEWALELKTLIEKEIADFPPLPVLPPPGPLEKISGVVEEVTLTKAMACFDAEAYSTMKDELERKRNRDNAGAAIAMAAQTLSGTAPHALINDGKANKLKCLYIKGKVNGKLFSGWLGMTNIRSGDFAEMAVVPSGDGYLTYAVANPELRTISLTPKCDMGYNTISLKQGMVIWLSFGAVFYAIGLAAAPSNWIITTVLYIAMSFLMSHFIMWRLRKENRYIMRLYDETCDVFMIPEYKKTGFRGYSKKKAKEVKLANGTPRSENVIMPNQNVNYVYEYFFYY